MSYPGWTEIESSCVTEVELERSRPQMGWPGKVSKVPEASHTDG